MVTLKSPRELSIMRFAGRIVAQAHAAMAERVRPGVSTRDLERFVEDFLRQRGAAPSFKGYRGFPGSICVAINDVICHGIPGPQRLREGDVVTIDIGAFYQGYHGDSAWTYAVGNISPEAQRLMDVGRQSLYEGIVQARLGNRLGDVSHAIQSYAEERGMGVVREFVGHGVGQSLHEGPEVPHFGKAATGGLLKPGMTLAIEPMITLGDWRSRLEPDGWTARTADGSLCVQFEHVVAVTEEGPLVLTEA